MTAYPNMKASGVSWVAAMPAHWESVKIGSLFSQRKAKVSDKVYTPLSVTKNGIVPQLANAAKSNDSDNRKLVCAGDFVINSRSDRKGSCGVSELTGSVSLINTVLKPRQGGNNRYVHYLLRSQPFSEEFYRCGRGIVADLWTTRFSEMKEIMLPVPPRTEQDQIVRFLDWKVSGINRLINIKKKEIARLGELKKTIVNEAVTHGINSNIPMKSSGVSWVAAMPAHWEMKRMRESFSFRKGLSITKANLEARGIPVISYGQVHSKSNSGVGLCEKLLRFVNPSYLDTSANALVAKNDFIFADTSEDLAGCGNCAFIDSDKYPIFAGYHSVIAHPLLNGNIKYLAYLFQSESWRHQIREKVNAVKVYSITQKILKDIFLLLPPTDEQDQIVRFLDWKVSGINRLINIKEKEINLLKEFRSRLISDAVTGQVDVRNIVVPEYEYVEENPDADPDSDDESEDVTDEED